MKSMRKFYLLILLGATASCPTYAQNVLTPKNIYEANREAVIEVFAGQLTGNRFDVSEAGTGFIVSANGMVVTANHVITCTSFDLI
ncbi:MAG TPA: hypothetical protein VFA39_04900 [Steroidobacteraceae bacterium]|nr:hypothetical protein [Steroidobacteraceae bacterium]